MACPKAISDSSLRPLADNTSQHVECPAVQLARRHVVRKATGHKAPLPPDVQVSPGTNPKQTHRIFQQDKGTNGWLLTIQYNTIQYM